MLPKLARSREIRDYVENIKEVRSTPQPIKERKIFTQRTSYEVNATQNYIDAPFYGLKQRVAVADFDNKLTGVPGNWNIGQGLADMLTTELLKTGRFIMVERQALADIVGEQQLGQAGLITKETAAKVGSLLGAKIIAKGVISEVDEQRWGDEGGIAYKGSSLRMKVSATHVAVDIRLIDTTTGEILYSHDAHGKAVDTGVGVGVQEKDLAFDVTSFQKTPLGQVIRRAIFDAIRFIISKMDEIPVEAQAIMIKGESIYLNAGSSTNIQMGDRLFAYSRGHEFADPKTGRNLGTEEMLVGTVEVTEVESKYSIGRLVSGKGKLKRGDTLRFSQDQGVRN